MRSPLLDTRVAYTFWLLWITQQWTQQLHLSAVHTSSNFSTFLSTIISCFSIFFPISSHPNGFEVSFLPFFLVDCFVLTHFDLSIFLAVYSIYCIYHRDLVWHLKLWQSILNWYYFSSNNGNKDFSKNFHLKYSTPLSSASLTLCYWRQLYLYILHTHWCRFVIISIHLSFKSYGK